MRFRTATITPGQITLTFTPENRDIGGEPVTGQVEYAIPTSSQRYADEIETILDALSVMAGDCAELWPRASLYEPPADIDRGLGDGIA